AGVELKDYMAARAKEIPLGRIGRAEEFANMACFLVSDLGSYITGTAINVDGGRSPGVYGGPASVDLQIECLDDRRPARQIGIDFCAELRRRGGNRLHKLGGQLLADRRLGERVDDRAVNFREHRIRRFRWCDQAVPSVRFDVDAA